MVGSWTDFNPYRTAASLVHVVLREPLPDLGRTAADDGVFIRVVVGRAAKNLRADDALLEEFGVPGQGLVDNVLQKLLGLLAGTKGRALKNLRESLLNLRRDLLLPNRRSFLGIDDL